MKKVRLGEVCTVVSGSTPKTTVAEFWDGNFNWITPAEINEDTVIIYESKRKITKKGVLATGLSSFPAGTVLLSSRAPIGKTAITGTEMYCNQGFKNLICNDTIYNKYLFWFLRSKTEYLNSLGRGATFKEISKSIVENIEIPLPSFEEQKKIASILDKFSDLITLRKQQLAKLDELVKARFVEMFGDPIENPKGWKVKTIKEVVASQKNAIKAGPFGSALKKEFYCSKGYKIYGQEQVINGDVNFGDYYISEEKYQELKSCSVQSGDVLISLVGTYGKSLIIPQNFQAGIINPRLIKITFDKTLVNVVYFQYYFSSNQVKNYLDEQIHGCTMGVLNLGIISALCMPLPPLALQNEFALYVEKIDKTKVDIKKSLEELNLLKKSLMQEYFG